jgi:hypothetical protein
LLALTAAAPRFDERMRGRPTAAPERTAHAAKVGLAFFAVPAAYAIDMQPRAAADDADPVRVHLGLCVRITPT